MEKPEIKLDAVVLDSDNIKELAEFYAALLDWEIGRQTDEFIAVKEPQGRFRLYVQYCKNYERPVWPEKANAQQQMVHMDFAVSNLEGAVQYAQKCGAKPASVQFLERTRVMLDPSGHPFCLFERQ